MVLLEGCKLSNEWCWSLLYVSGLVQQIVHIPPTAYRLCLVMEYEPVHSVQCSVSLSVGLICGAVFSPLLFSRRRVANNLEQNLPSLDTLILTNNNFQELVRPKLNHHFWYEGFSWLCFFLELPDFARLCGAVFFSFCFCGLFFVAFPLVSEVPLSKNVSFCISAGGPRSSRQCKNFD